MLVCCRSVTTRWTRIFSTSQTRSPGFRAVQVSVDVSRLSCTCLLQQNVLIVLFVCCRTATAWGHKSRNQLLRRFSSNALANRLHGNISLKSVYWSAFRAVLVSVNESTLRCTCLLQQNVLQVCVAVLQLISLSLSQTLCQAR